MRMEGKTDIIGMHRNVYITKHNLSETAFCLRLQVKQNGE
jgi:hypothetical protein